ncbi:MAG: Tlg2-vesicle protein [Peltula sp. TS41687]|nr:MAG: Tlg2-vesicle protein [Peltula sp. TS41687]
MAEGYQSMARALSMPVSPSTSPSQARRSILPSWMPSSSVDSSPLRSRSPNRHHRPTTAKERWLKNAVRIQLRATKTFMKLTLLQRVLAVIALVLAAVFGVLFLVFNERIFAWLEPYADKWRALPGGWLIIWALTFLTAFPPVVGYSSCLTTAGFLYGFPWGWFITSSATICGSLGSFMLSRNLLSGYVRRLIENDKRFGALTLTLKHDGLKLLILIRLCPLPYSLLNGALATIPTVNPLYFTLATAITSPKLMLQTFIGGRLGKIAKDGGTMDIGTKILNYASIVLGIVLGVIVAVTIYRNTVARAKELEAEEEERLREPAGQEELARELYSDADPDARLRNTESADDISLFETEAEAERLSYRDELNVDDDTGFGRDSGDEERNIGLPAPRTKREER